MKLFYSKVSLTAIAVLFVITLVVPSVKAASDWTVIGPAHFTAGYTNHIARAVSPSGELYVMYDDGTDAAKPNVVKFNGTDWDFVGSPNFTGAAVNNVSITFGPTGTPYILFGDARHTYKLTVMKFNGTAWETVGNEGFTSQNMDYPSFVVDSTDTPYLVYQDKDNGYKATMARFNGTAWETVGTAGFTTGFVSYTSLAIDSSDNIYFAFSAGDISGKARVMKFDGTNWEVVGNDGFSVGGPLTISLVFDSAERLYMGYADSGASNKASVVKFNGTSWQAVGAPNFTEDSAVFTSLAFNSSNTLFMSYRDGSIADKAAVVKFNGTAWEAVGTPGFTPGAVYSPILTAIGDELFVTYADGADGNKMSMMTLADSSSYEYGEESGGSGGGTTPTPPNNDDGNNDGTKDSEQNNVETILSPVSNQYVTVEVDTTCALSDVSIADANNNASEDSTYSYKSGFVNFTASGCSGDSTDVKIYYHGVSPDGLIARKYNPNTNTYFTIGSAKLTALDSPLSGTLVSYTVTDNGELDIDPTNGVIVDPVGLASAAGAPNTGLKQQGMFIFIASVLVGLGLVVSQTKIHRSVRKKV